MFHTPSRSRWIPLAVTALLMGLVTLVAPTAAGAQDAPTYTVEINGDCPATIDDVFSYTVVVTNNGVDPIEVTALDQTFTVAAGATESLEFPGEVLGELQGSIRIDGEAPEEIAVALPGCIAPQSDVTIEYETPCPGDTGPGFATFTNVSALLPVVTADDLTFTVEPNGVLSMAVAAGLTIDDFTINGGPVPDGAFTLAPDFCDDPPSSNDDPPSSDDDAIPISAPLSPKFTG